ncbi:hypothetical protein D3C84_1123500 [compost metagenome]
MVLFTDVKRPAPPFSVLVRITMPRFISGYIVTIDSIPGNPPVCDTLRFPFTSLKLHPKP